MQSPQVMNIWASGKEQPLGKAAQRGQAAMMGKTTQYGFVCQPIRSYQQQLRDPEPQDAVPRPTAQTMEESDSTGSFELVQQDEEAPAITRQRREEGQHQAMPGGSAASSAAPRDASQEGRNAKRKVEKQEAETKYDMVEARVRFQRLQPPRQRDVEEATKMFIWVERRFVIEFILFFLDSKF